uniref:hypothetical protein n=1 Tax=Agathobacter sp. TaxID=2021311 RepID=UPI0040572CAC
MEGLRTGRVMIECSNTIFHLYIRTEEELKKFEVFMRNLRSARQVSIMDVYQWCNRHGVSYNTNFNFRRNMGFINTIHSYINYMMQKMKYQFGISFACART